MGILDLFFPRRCVGCGRVGKYICDRCIRKVEYIENQICPVCGRYAIEGRTHPKCCGKYAPDGMFVPVHYRGPVKKGIKLIKYRYVSDLAGCLVEFISRTYPAYLPHFDFLVPVPLFPGRERERGFNQSRVISQMLGRLLNFQTKDALVRKRNTKPQAGLRLEERQVNLKGAFSICPQADIHGKTIMVVDDVITTRATILECSNILKRNGAHVVWAIAIAHG